jgi:hypothetical protein
MTELMNASRQWASRPADQRFWTLREMRDACKKHADDSHEIPVFLSETKVVSRGDELAIVGRSGIPADLTNYAYHQLAGIAKVPGGYLASLDAKLAADCMNASLEKVPTRGDERRMLLQKNGHVEARCVVSTKYKRVWNYSLCDRLLTLGDAWKNPPAWAHDANDPRKRVATEADVIPGVSIVKVGDEITPAGLYASDRDMFAFLVNTGRVIDGSPKGLSVGFFVWNSEVGDKSLGLMTFAFDYVCGNHIVWGASDVRELRMRHVGDILGKSSTIVEAARFADQAAGEFEAKIAWAKTYEIAASPEDVVLEVVKRIDVSSKLAMRALEVATENEASYGNPRSVWGVVSGLTQIARDMPHADARNALDVEAGKLLDAF